MVTSPVSVSGRSPLSKSLRHGNRQYAALPVKITEAGAVEVMLITSRGSRRWIIPKGWPMKKKTNAEAAVIEAYEEAGLEGRPIGRHSIGTYRYIKDEASGGKIRMRVDVYLMQVSQQLEDWPERAERETQWLPPHEAAVSVKDTGLGRIIRKVPALCRRRKTKKPRLELIEQNGDAPGVRLRPTGPGQMD